MPDRIIVGASLKKNETGLFKCSSETFVIAGLDPAI
jgi:hypothetical protein